MMRVKRQDSSIRREPVCNTSVVNETEGKARVLLDGQHVFTCCRLQSEIVRQQCLSSAMLISLKLLKCTAVVIALVCSKTNQSEGRERERESLRNSRTLSESGRLALYDNNKVAMFQIIAQFSAHTPLAPPGGGGVVPKRGIQKNPRWEKN